MPDRLAQRLAALAGLVLYLAPAGFRAEFGDELVSSFARLLDEERRQRGPVAMWRLWIRGLVDAIRTAIRERRLAPRRPHHHPFANLSDDVRSAVRGWRRTQGFFITIVVMLVLGIGLASSIFAFADGYLFRPLPFPAAERLYFVDDPDARVASALKESDVIALRGSAVARFGFVEWGGSTPIVGFGDLLIGEQRVQVRSEGVSAGFAQVLQMPLAAGRDFTAADCGNVTPVPAWVSYRFWHHELGGDRSILGRTLTMANGRDRIVIVGIMDRRVTAFDLNNPPPDLVLPAVTQLVASPNLLAFPIIRLPNDVSPLQAEAEIGSVLQSLAPAPAGRVRRVQLSALYEYQVAGGRPTARVFFIGVLLVVMLITMSLIHLLLSRGISRAAETTTRVALGASRWRIARMFVVESLLVGGAGIAGGLALGLWLASIIADAVPTYPTGARNLSLVVMSFDARTVTFAIVLGLTVALVAGVWPARQAWRRPLAAGFRSATAGGDHLSSRTLRMILASEVAVSTVILVGTAFMGLGIWRYLSQPLGFDLRDRWNVYLEPPPGTRTDPSGLDWSIAVDAVRATPGVSAAAVRRDRPAGSVKRDDDRPLGNDVRAVDVGDGYFDAWGLRPKRGRLFTREEVRGNAPVTIVDEAFARRVWPDDDAIGKLITIGAGLPRQVVGIVAHERRSLARETPGTAYVPRSVIDRREAIVVWAPVETASQLSARLRSALAQIAPGYRPVVTPITFENTFTRDAGEAVFQRPILVIFGVSALVIAGVGLFGVVAYVVEQRTRDFGIRLALGARPDDIWRRVLGQSMLPALAGLLIGLAVARSLEGAVRGSVFGWESSGPVAMVAVAAALLGVAALAAIGPARRAMGTDPIKALRGD